MGESAVKCGLGLGLRQSPNIAFVHLIIRWIGLTQNLGVPQLSHPKSGPAGGLADRISRQQGTIVAFTQEERTLLPEILNQSPIICEGSLQLLSV